MMLHIKRMVCIVLTVAVMSMHSGCANDTSPKVTLPDDVEIVASNKQYDVLRGNGAFFLNFHEERNVYVAEGGLKATDWPEFQTVGQMKESILSGDIPESDMLNLEAQWNSGVVQICDLANLFVPVLPLGLGYSKVIFEADEYVFSLCGANGEDGFLRIKAADDYQSDLEHNFTTVMDRVSQKESTEVHMRRTNPEKNADVMYYSNMSGRWSTVHYTYSLPGKTLHVEESWSGACPFAMVFCGGEAGRLVSLEIWGEENGGYFYCFLYFTDAYEVPGDEWVQSFGLKPYVETETE